jgi:hypothetical protein
MSRGTYQLGRYLPGTGPQSTPARFELDQTLLPGGVSVQRERAKAPDPDDAADNAAPRPSLLRDAGHVAAAALPLYVVVQVLRGAAVPRAVAWATLAFAGYGAWRLLRSMQPEAEPPGPPKLAAQQQQLVSPSDQWVAGLSRTPTITTSTGRVLPVYY